MHAEAGDKESIEEARQQVARGEAQAVDVRDEEQWSEGHVTGAVHLPKDRLSTADEVLDQDRRVIVFAADDKGAAEAAETLRDAGFDAAVAEGGMDAWTSEDFKTQPSQDPDDDTELGAG